MPIDLEGALGPADEAETTDSECALLRVRRERVAIDDEVQPKYKLSRARTQDR